MEVEVTDIPRVEVKISRAPGHASLGLEWGK